MVSSLGIDFALWTAALIASSHVGNFHMRSWTPCRASFAISCTLLECKCTWFCCCASPILLLQRHQRIPSILGHSCSRLYRCEYDHCLLLIPGKAHPQCATFFCTRCGNVGAVKALYHSMPDWASKFNSVRALLCAVGNQSCYECTSLFNILFSLLHICCIPLA